MTPAKKPQPDLHYMSVYGCTLSCNGKKYNLGTNTFSLHPRRYVVFLDSSQVLVCGVICAHMKE